MSLTDTDDPNATTTAVVTIRIPCGTDGELVTTTAERLARADSVKSVTIDELRNIEPKLSATLITVAVTLRWRTPSTDTQVRARLTDVAGLVSIEVIET